MSKVSNEEISRLMASPFILYVEGQGDERILRAWADTCGGQAVMENICFKAMEGGDKGDMKARADEHFNALRQIVPEVSRLMLFDYDDSNSAFHPKEDNPTLAEWKRKNIENYLLVPEAWKRAALKQLQCDENDFFAKPIFGIIDEFFVEQNLTLPAGKSWRNVVRTCLAWWMESAYFSRTTTPFSRSYEMRRHM